MVFPWFSHGFPLVFPTARPTASQELCEVHGFASEQLSAQLGGEGAGRQGRRWGHGKTMGKPWENGDLRICKGIYS